MMADRSVRSSQVEATLYIFSPLTFLQQLMYLPRIRLSRSFIFLQNQRRVFAVPVKETVVPIPSFAIARLSPVNRTISALRTHTCGYMFNDNQFVIKLDRIGDQLLFYGVATLIAVHRTSFPDFEVTPQFRIRFVRCNNLNRPTRWIAALDVQRPPQRCLPID
jgi:hypothetical protein